MNPTYTDRYQLYQPPLFHGGCFPTAGAWLPMFGEPLQPEGLGLQALVKCWGILS